MEKSRIVIIGAGYAGVLTAKKLAKKVKKAKKTNSVSITIIDKNPFHAMLTELHEVAANRVVEDSIKMNLKKIFSGREVNVVHDFVEKIDYEDKLVTGRNDKYEYDYLVIAAGSKPTYFGVTGADEYSHKLWSYEDAVNLRAHILESFRKAACEVDLEERKKLLTFYIVGAGFTGVEMAGELAEYAPFLCKEYYIDTNLVNIVNVDILKRPVPNLPEKLSDKVEKRYKKMGIKTMLNTSVCGVGPDYIEVKNGEACTRHYAGTVIWAAGIESADIAGEASKVLASAGRGRIKVDSFLRSVDDDNVYVIGDNMFFIAEGEDRPVPQMVENCEQSSEVAANNLLSAVTGVGKMEHYKPSYHGMMICIGGRYGVARVGTPNRMFNVPSFFAMFLKHFINVVYFVQVLGWNKVFNYLKHEFFTIRNCRSFLGGHFSNRTPSFLLVALRVWLGIVWLFEGVMKIAGGWMTSPKLSGFFGGANAWYDSILGSVSSTAGTAAADAVSSGTAPVVTAVAEAVTSATAPVVTAVAEAVTSATAPVATAVAEAVTSATAPIVEGAGQAIGTILMNFNLLGLVRFILVSGKELAQSTLSDFAFKLDIPLMNWFVNNLILPNDSVQMFMQIFIVIAEILIGLALIGGLFTTPASALSVVLQIMFLCTTGLYLGTIWMLFAGIAVLIGAGRIFGLDYYVMPHVKKWWKNIPLVRKLYIYND